MTLERRDPIPPGRYWLHVRMPDADGGKQGEAFSAWVLEQNGSAAEFEQAKDRPVQILSTQDGEPDGMAFVIFRLIKPVPRWPLSAGLGAPSIAPDSIRDASDVTQAPELPAGATEQGGAIEQISGALKVIGFGAIAAYLLGKLITRK